MPLSDFLYVIRWWAILLSIGAIFFPCNTLLFRKFFDKGYIFAKILGIIITSYIALVLGVLHIAQFSQLTLFFILVGCAGAQLVIVAKYKSKKRQKFLQLLFSPAMALIVIEELLFLATLLSWSYVRAHQPDIHGLEKFMDFGFVNSIVRADYFPPKDMWLTSFPINYYYFGHLVTAVLTKLSGIPTSISFNLMLGTLFAFTFTAGLSLGGNFWTKFLQSMQKTKFLLLSFLVAGILSGYMLSCAGSFHTLYSFFTPYENEHPVPIWQLKFSPATFPNSYWYPNATRYIYHTIHEFPLYSFVVSDLHGHVLDIPFVLFTLALLATIFIDRDEKQKSSLLSSYPFLSKISSHLPLLPWWIFIGFLLAVMYMTNALDGLIYLLLSGIVVFFVYKSLFKKNWVSTIFQTPFFTSCVIILGSFLLFSLPFSVFFKSFVNQIGLVCPPLFLVKLQSIGPFVFEPSHCERSPWWQLFVLYGFFGFWFLCLVTVLLRTKRVAIDYFMLLLGLFAIFLIIIPEFFYFRDIYTTFYRANTMFKFVYQAFMLLSLVSIYAVARTFSALASSWNSIFKILGSLPVIFIGLLTHIVVGIYPYFAVGSYYDNLKTYYGLDGTTYLFRLYPDDYTAIAWINSHISEQPVMLEAQGDSYTDFERISANTGLPTVLGWGVHEWLWHGTYDVVPPRQTDIQTLYETKDLAVAKKTLQKYHISYVYVGDMERQKYPKLSEEKFATLGTVVYSKNSTTIYQLSF